MKNLKNNFAKILIVIGVLCVFASCKKSNENTSPEDTLDLTQYNIVGKFSNADKLPYIITFDALAKSNKIAVGSNQQASYVYKNGVLTLDYGAGKKDVFKINNGTIASFEGSSTLDSYSLQKIPATNQLVGNFVFTGFWKTSGSATQTTTTFDFEDGTTNTLDKDYILIKNIAVTSSNTNVLNGTVSFFVLIDGKLEGSRNRAGEIQYGSFIKVY